MELSKEMRQRALSCKSAEELIAAAKEYGQTLNRESAEKLLASLQNPGEMSDDELNAVAGGGCGGGKMERTPCDYQVGDHIRLRGYATCGDAYNFINGGNRGCMARSWRVTGIRETEYKGQPTYSLDCVCDICGGKIGVWVGNIERM